jgi:hypothetical protein
LLCRGAPLPLVPPPALLTGAARRSQYDGCQTLAHEGGAVRPATRARAALDDKSLAERMQELQKRGDATDADDTVVYPTVQLQQLGVREDERVVSPLLKSAGAARR